MWLCEPSHAIVIRICEPGHDTFKSHNGFVAWLHAISIRVTGCHSRAAANELREAIRVGVNWSWILCGALDGHRRAIK
jgi:hypothetical protein